MVTPTRMSTRRLLSTSQFQNTSRETSAQGDVKRYGGPHESRENCVSHLTPISSCEACSGFTRVTARWTLIRPRLPLSSRIEGFRDDADVLAEQLARLVAQA